MNGRMLVACVLLCPMIGASVMMPALGLAAFLACLLVVFCADEICDAIRSQTAGTGRAK
jgi:hypothetical protein